MREFIDAMSRETLRDVLIVDLRATFAGESVGADADLPRMSSPSRRSTA